MKFRRKKQRRRPPPAAETGRSCWGRGQQDTSALHEVEPGFGGQKFMPSALEKLRWLKEERAKRSARYLLEVDGGVDDTTAPLCVEAGADILVAGSAVFGAADPAAAVRRLAAL